MSKKDGADVGTQGSTASERIAARKNRIQGRLSHANTERGGGGGAAKKGGSNNTTNTHLARGQQQIHSSLANLDRMKYDSVENVSNIRVESDRRENERRIVEEQRRDKRIKELREESMMSTEKSDVLESHWDQLDDIHMPQNLQKEIDRQKEACNEIIASKDFLIEQFQQELKAKDEEYVKMLKSQVEDVEQLILRMRNQFSHARYQYAMELEAVEEAFLKEREEVLAANQDEINSLFSKRREMELDYMESKQKKQQEYMDEISKMRVRDSEEYHKLKIKLETDIQTLEQQLQEMRATYQLNTEKLDYNFRILSERDMENRVTLKQQRKKLQRLSDQVASLKARYKKNSEMYRRRNKELSEEHNRATQHYKDLQKKFKHFENSDNEKYDKIFAMHVEEVQELVDKTLLADKIITEQQLGWQWAAPPAHLLPQPTSGRGKEAKEGLATIAEGGSAGDGHGSASGNANASAETDPATATAIVRRAAGDSRVKAERISRMLDLLTKEASFLVSSDMRAKMQSMAADRKSEMATSAILKALGVEDDADVNTLLSFFFDHNDEDDEDYEDELAPLGDLGIKVRQDDIIKVINMYVKAREADEADEQQAVLKHVEEVGVAKKTSAKKLFWQSLANVVPDRTVRVWEQLESTLTEYTHHLEGRAESLKRVSDLRQQNEELKSLLNQYLHADVNSQLHVPPTQTIRLGDM
eukprot:INCI9973.1.p1 GENE.INCI9973.1~~INCI9973.1.p1  ORF type:complete len:702 (-),score=185.87 INCI9973.1:209-2314(-)